MSGPEYLVPVVQNRKSATDNLASRRHNLGCAGENLVCIVDNLISVAEYLDRIAENLVSVAANPGCAPDNPDWQRENRDAAASSPQTPRPREMEFRPQGRSQMEFGNEEKKESAVIPAFRRSGVPAFRCTLVKCASMSKGAERITKVCWPESSGVMKR